MRFRRSLFSSAVVAVTGLLLATLHADDWPRFRGSDGSGVAAGQSIPLEFGTETNVAWQVDLPAGTSSPIIIGERLLLTSYSDDTRTLHCLNAVTGESLWSDEVTKTHTEIATPPADPATSTPVSDGRNVFVFFPDAGIHAWSLDGKKLWDIPADQSHTMHGLSSSLVCADGVVVQVVDQLRDSFIAAYDAETGDPVWKNERVSGLTGAYATPVIYTPSGSKTQVVVAGPFELVSYDLATGERLWWVVGMCNAPVSSPILRGDTIYICESVGEPIPMSMMGGMDKDRNGELSIEEVADQEAIRRLIVRIDDQWGDGNQIVDETEWDKAFGSFEGKGGLVAMAAGGTGDMTERALKWSYRKKVPYIPGALVSDLAVFIVDDGGLVTSFDRETGDVIEKGRLKKARGKYYASPVGTDDHIVFVDTEGVVSVVTSQPEWEAVFTAELGEPVYATPAIAGNRLYVRTTKTLYCFGAG